MAGCAGRDENDDGPLFGSVLVLAKLLARSEPVLARLLKLNEAALGDDVEEPIRSGMTSAANAAKEQAPPTRATKGAHRQLNTLGSPESHIRWEA
jgi:hypothetical protein